MRWVVVCAAYGVVLACIIAGSYLGVVPTKLGAIPFSDKLGHFGLIGGAALLLDLAWRHRSRIHVPRLGWRAIPTAAIVVFLAAAMEETAQLLSPRRSFELLDITADLLGVAVFCWAGGFALARLRQVTRPRSAADNRGLLPELPRAGVVQPLDDRAVHRHQLGRRPLSGLADFDDDPLRHDPVDPRPWPDASHNRDRDQTTSHTA